MNYLEYENINHNEATHFYYVGTQRIILSFLQKYIQELFPKKKIKILDAGCGTGLLASRMCHFGEVTGLDIHQEAVEFTRGKGIKVVIGSVNQMPFPDGYFDIVVGVDILYHKLVDDKHSIKEFARVLRPGGLLLLKEPSYNWLRGSHDDYVQTERRFNKLSMLSLVEKAGFELLELTYLASFLLIPALIKRFIQEKFIHSLPGSDVKKPNYLLNKILIWLFRIEEVFLHHADLPFGLSVMVIAKKVNESGKDIECA